MNLITIRREKSHISESKEIRNAFINKKRFVDIFQLLEHEPNFYINQPQRDLFLKITSQQSILELISGGLKNLKLLVYLTWVDDLDLEVQMKSLGLCEYFIELTKQIVKHTEEFYDYDQILCQILTGMNNLSQASPMNQSYVECILIWSYQIQCSDRLVEIILSIIKSSPQSQLCKPFIFQHWERGPQIAADALFALQAFIKQHRCEKFEQSEIKILFDCIQQGNKNLRALCCVALKKMYKNDSYSFKIYFRAHKVNDLLTSTLKESKNLHLVKFLRDCYPDVRVDYQVLFDLFDVMICIKQIKVYLVLLNKYVDDGLIFQYQILNHLKTKMLCQSSELTAECMDEMEIYIIAYN
ncbi:hypothetical protein pb186bvf_001161 [Paramecium bursaria]